MDSLSIIGTARRNSGLKSWYLRHSLIGKRVLRNALESQYGKQEKILDNGVRKFVKEKTLENGNSSTTTTYVEPVKLRDIRTNLREYDSDGNRIAFSSFAKDTNDKHRKISMKITDMPKLGRRDYIYSVLRYDLETFSWVTESVDKRTFLRQPSGEMKVKSVHKDCVARTTEVNDTTINLR